MKKVWIPVLASSLLLVSACAGPDSTKEPNTDVTPTVDAGTPEAIYQKNCMNCHGGKLQGGVGPGLTNIGGQLSKDEIQNILENGKGRMPAQKSYIKAEDLDKLATWLSEKK